jgi:hypothetical protein
MPDVKLYYPRGQYESSEAKANLMDAVSASVAIALECADYAGEPLNLHAAEVELTLVPYERACSRRTSQLVVEIVGHDYPDRMRDIDDRLESIKKVLLRDLGYTTSVKYFRIGERCWV